MNVTIQRHYNGIGDHLMALACVKYVNRQRPDVQVFVDFKRIKVGRLPSIIPDLYRASDAVFTEGLGTEGPVTHDSLVYRKWPPELYIESMVDHLNLQTDLAIRYEHGVWPEFGQRWIGGNTIVMVGQGKGRKRGGKEWGVLNFAELARLLHRAGLPLIQIGAENDVRLPHARDLCGADARTLVDTLCGARLFIGLENGIMVLAGYLGVPQLTIYDGHSHPTRIQFEHQAKIIERIEPDEVARRITKEGVPCSSSAVSAGKRTGT